MTPIRSRTARLALCLCLLPSMFAAPADARREVWTDDQKSKLQQASRLFLDTVVLTSQADSDRAGIETVLSERLQSLGYTIVRDAAHPSDLTLKVKCEERKTWEGPLRSGGDADQPDAAVRLWKGPACQFSYRLEQRWADWRHEVRAEQAGDSGTQAGPRLIARLREDGFPFLLAAEWQQAARLLPVLSDPATTAQQQAAIATLLGNMSAVEAIPALGIAVQSPRTEVSQAALVALGNIGQEQSIPILLTALASTDPRTRLAAIRGLGRLAPLYPTSDIIMALLAQLPREPIGGQIEIVRALGRTTDRRIVSPLKELNRKVQEQARSDSAADLKELRIALGQALDQFDGTHTAD